jgi:hypothetical protein
MRAAKESRDNIAKINVDGIAQEMFANGGGELIGNVLHYTVTLKLSTQSDRLLLSTLMADIKSVVFKSVDVDESEYMIRISNGQFIILP